jgi:transposase-like protein
MTKSESGSEILPIDRKGRVRVSRERREQLLEEFEESKLSGQQFAKLTGIKYSTFSAWVHKRRRQPSALTSGLPSAGQTSAVEWLETVITNAQQAGPGTTPTLVVRLPSGAAMELSNASQAPMAAALLRAWEKASC